MVSIFKELKCKSTLLVPLLMVLGGGLSCSHLLSTSEKPLRNSVLSNLNPAPKRFSPPEDGKIDDPQDPANLQSQADYHYSMAEALSLNGRTHQAIEEFRLVLIYDPDSLDVRMRIAKEFWKAGLMSESIEQAEMAVKLEPSREDSRQLLAGMYAALKMYDRASHEYRQLLKYHPENREAPIFIGTILAEQKKYDEAQAIFVNAVKEAPEKEKYKPYYYLGRVLSERGEEYSKQALQAFAASLQHNPKYLEALMGMVQVYSTLNQKKDILRVLNAYYEKFGAKQKISLVLSQLYMEEKEFSKALEHLKILVQFDSENINIHFQIAMILVELEKYAASAEKLEEIKAQMPGSDKVLFFLGGVYEELKEDNEALVNFTAIAPSSGYYGEAIIHMVHIQKKRKNLDLAVEIIRGALEKRGDIAQFYAFYASILEEKKQYKEAAAVLEKGLLTFQDNVQIHFFLGAIYDHLNKKSETISHMLKVLSLNADHAQALNYLAYTYAELGRNLEEAEALAKRALTIKPGDGFVLDTLGWVLFKQGPHRINEAIQTLESAREKAKNKESIISEHLGDAYFSQELVKKAKKMYLEAIANEKDHEKIGNIKRKILAIENQEDQKSTRKPAGKATAISN